MESVLHKIRYMRSQMGPGEKKIADYLLENTQDIISSSISDFADKCGCGDATVVRFARRLGFDGYQSLKIGIAGEISASSTVSEEITADDSCYEIFKKRIKDISVSLNNTESVLNEEHLKNATYAIINAKRIVIFGLGNSAAIAQDAAHKFLRLGLNALACCDNHIQAIIASHLDRQSVCIGVSHSGSSKDIIDALQLSKIGGATTIGITNFGNSPIIKHCDYTLFTRSEETQHSILAMNSRIAQLAIFDAIYTYIVVNSNKLATQEIYKTELALQNKKY